MNWHLETLFNRTGQAVREIFECIAIGLVLVSPVLLHAFVPRFA